MEANQIQAVIYGYSNEHKKMMKVVRHAQPTDKSVKEIMEENNMEFDMAFDRFHYCLNGIPMRRKDCLTPLLQVINEYQTQGHMQCGEITTVNIVASRVVRNISPRQIAIPKGCDELFDRPDDL